MISQILFWSGKLPLTITGMGWLATYFLIDPSWTTHESDKMPNNSTIRIRIECRLRHWAFHSYTTFSFLSILEYNFLKVTNVIRISLFKFIIRLWHNFQAQTCDTRYLCSKCDLNVRFDSLENEKRWQKLSRIDCLIIAYTVEQKQI